MRAFDNDFPSVCTLMKAFALMIDLWGKRVKCKMLNAEDSGEMCKKDTLLPTLVELVSCYEKEMKQKKPPESAHICILFFIVYSMICFSRCFKLW